jgi:hypothetical protein
MFSQTIAESAETIRAHATLVEQMKASMQQLIVELAKRDRDVDRDLMTLEKRLNRHRVAIDRGEDQVRLASQIAKIAGLTFPC